jgi:dihydroorotate dehydrogenase
MLFISPPFGNYLNLPNTISINGSFTVEKRNGLFTQILKTLRYSYEYGGWVNKIGFRNKGIDWALKNIPETEIISVGIMKKEDIDIFYEKIPKNRNIEINISCPNVDKNYESINLSKLLSNERKWCIIKVSPNISYDKIDYYYNQGFRQFHCCNTIPVKEGGLSGKSIQPYSLKYSKYIRDKYPDTIIISGGGINTIKDYNMYKKNGANHCSISTVCFCPYLFLKLYKDYLFSNFD